MNQRPLSGDQLVLRSGELRATVATVGASLREYRQGDRHLTVPFAAHQPRPNFRGLTVAPWPNRVVDGQYSWRGERHQLPINEVDRGHALHGFTSWLLFHVTASDESSVTLEAVVEAQSGYPWSIGIETKYSLDPGGLTQTVLAKNLSDEPAPYGVCPHPYLVAGPGHVDDWTLTLPADTVLTVSEPRLAPETLESVRIDRQRFDFREARRIGSVEIDHAFTDIRRDARGRARVELRSDSGTGVAMVWDEVCSWLQIHTADLPDNPDSHRIGLAVEPMTCGPDSFNRGSDWGLVTLEPGTSHRAEWRIEPL